jgi:hypothetical protein
MVNYQLGKIYRIVCNTTGLVYVGSTCEPTLAKRLQAHKRDYKCHLNGKDRNMTSFKILENNNYEIVLIESFPCNSKDELHQRERHYIETTPCVNKVIPSRTKKEWCEVNKESLLEKGKIYRENNQETIMAYKAINKEYMKERAKKYREENKEMIKERYKKYYQDKKQNKPILVKPTTNKELSKERRREYLKKYAEDNKDKLKERDKKYREKNKDAVKEKNKKYREKQKTQESRRNT